jgi:predicted ATPase
MNTAGCSFRQGQVADCDRAATLLALRELEAAGLVHIRGQPEGICTFKHVLVMEAAYSRLLRADRQKLHLRIVMAFESQSSDLVEWQPQVRAQHCAAAGLVEKAVTYSIEAGHRAMSHFALQEAIAHFTKSLSMLRDLSPTEHRKRTEVALQVALGDAFISAGGYGADEAGRAFTQAHELIHEIGGSPQLFHVLAGKFIYHEVRAEIDRSQAAARELLRLSEEQGDVAGQIMAHRDLGDSLLHGGDFSMARSHFDRVLRLFASNAPPVFAGEDMRVAALAFLSISLAMLGFPTAAETRSEESLEQARRSMRHPHTLALALNVACRLQFLLRNQRRVEENSNELCSLAAEHGLTYMQAQGTLHRGRTLVLGRRFGEAVSVLEEGIALVRATGAARLLSFNLGALAVAYQHTGRMEEARFALGEALRQVRRTGVGWAKAELERLEANLALSAAVPDLAFAETNLRRAIATARRQDAKWWQLRTSADLARLWHRQGKHAQAPNLLVPIFKWFGEGFGTLDLIEVKALLDDLR